MKNSLILLVLFILCVGFQMPSKSTDHFDVTITQQEQKLYNLLMQYRKSKGLGKIPLSMSLTYVAQQHCIDLSNNKPDLKEKCNAHSWSENEKWSGCCYTPDHKQGKCMWDKPRELTEYTGNGYEIACGSSDPRYSSFVMTADYAIEAWKKSVHHNNVIINQDIWKNADWKAIGIGIYGGFATVWFGKETDKAGSPN